MIPGRLRIQSRHSRDLRSWELLLLVYRVSTRKVPPRKISRLDESALISCNVSRGKECRSTCVRVLFLRLETRSRIEHEVLLRRIAAAAVVVVVVVVVVGIGIQILSQRLRGRG
ncbi:hypothetical protein BDW72DRAFT_119321 [Aspergillus terricola var. indicus]